MDFNEEGFLGDSITDFKISVESKYAQFFELYRRTNKIAHEMKFRLEPPNNDGQKIIAVALFIRLLNVRRLTWFNIAAHSSDPNFESLRNDAKSHPGFCQELKEEIEKNGWEKLNVEEIAKRSGLISMYDTHYRLLSEEVHTVPRSLESLLSFTEDQTPSTFEWGPNDQELPFTLLTGVQMLLVGMKAICTLCGIYDQQEELLLEIDTSLTELWQDPRTLDIQ